MLTTEQILNRTKTVTRRLGWRLVKAGDTIAACKKCMGLKKGEKIERLAVLRVVSVTQERLGRMLDDDLYGKVECVNEGFPDMTIAEFVDFFCRSHSCDPEIIVTRIEFVYVTDGSKGLTP